MRRKSDLLAGLFEILLCCAVGILCGIFLGKAIVGLRSFFSEKERVYEIRTLSVPEEITEEELLREFYAAEKDGVSMREKIGLLTTAMRREFSLLGIMIEPQLDIEFLEGTRLGYCEVKTGRIVLDAEHVRDDSLEDCLEILFHECRHCYQWQMFRLYDGAPEDLKALSLFEGMEAIGAELTDYVTAEEDRWGYYSQRCESDARKYAEERLLDWIRMTKTAVAF